MNSELQTHTTAFVLIYNEVILYPPTINAIHLLASRFSKVIVLELTGENRKLVQWPANVLFYKVNRRFESFLSKLKTYYRFLSLVRKRSRIDKPGLVLFYDSLTAMMVFLSKKSLPGKPLYWYHNHDVYQPEHASWYSLIRMSHQFEKKIMGHLDILSLPAIERKGNFDLDRLKGKLKFIPNYPARQIVRINVPQTAPKEIIKIIYQGNISNGHGIEELLTMMPITINGKSVYLGLIGIIQDEYRKKLNDIIHSRNLESNVKIYDPIPYPDLFTFTRQFHIGLAIYTKTDIMNRTLGTASNKIYEYTACGLPLLYYDAPHFIEHLQSMNWAFPTDLSTGSLVSAIQKIDEQYTALSNVAHQAFLHHLNFEKVFNPVLDEAIEIMEERNP